MRSARRNVSPLIVLLALFIPLTACSGDLNADLLKAAYEGHTETVKALLEAGADVNAKIVEGEFKGATALFWAAGKGHTEIVQVLIAKGADVNAKGVKGWTALMLAAENRHTEIVSLLKQAGAKE